MAHRVIVVLLALFAFAAGDSSALIVHSPTHLARREYGANGVDFGPTILSGKDYRGRVVMVSSAELCKGGSSHNWRGAVLMTTSGDCAVVEKALMAESNGAVGLLLPYLSDSHDECERKKTDVGIPVETLRTTDYNAIKAAVDQNIVVVVSLGYSLNVLRYAI